MLHLNKALKTGLIIVGIIVALAGTIYGSFYLGDRLDQKTTEKNKACATGQHSNHKVTIQGDKVMPENIVAPLCDTLTITNLDDKERLIAFGPHDEHVPYDGVAEKLLEKDQSLTVTLVEAGNFRIHDHAEDEVQGTFTVTTVAH